MVTIKDLLEKHVTLEVESLDRLYLNGYLPKLQTPGQLVTFLMEHRGHPIPSPALLGQMTTAFRSGVEAFAAHQGLQIVRFARGQRKDDLAAEHRGRFSASEGVYLIGVAQEKCNAFKATKRREPGSSRVRFEYARQPVCVNQYYFYLLDEEFGPAFIKIGSYAPFPIKVCLNGHEWLKRQLPKEGIAFEELDNGIRCCDDPKRLQALSNRLGPSQIVAFLQKWLARLPLPLTPADRAAGYDYRLSIWQVEISLTQVFERPLRGRQFFEEVIRENVDLGRPDRLQLVFGRRVTKATPGRFRTRVIQTGVHPSLHVEYKSCHLKQYFKAQRALRTETTINNTGDFRVGKDLANLWTLRDIGRAINRRLLEVERVSQHCTLSPDTVEQITHPTVTPDGQRAPSLRFGARRTMALFWALTLMCHLARGFTNGSLRPHVAALLGPDAAYGPSQMTYDLRRLIRKSIIQRQGRSHRYTLTPYGQKVVLFFTKLDARVFRPAFAALGEPDGIPRPLAHAFRQLDKAVDALINDARLGLAA